MMQPTKWLRFDAVIILVLGVCLSGCTCPREFCHNGCKVGPNPKVPCGPTAPDWIDAADVRVRPDDAEIEQWWSLFKDPTLDSLVSNAAAQNLSLREAGYRILEARAMLGIAKGNLFPQQQSAFGGYQRFAESQVAGDSDAFSKQFFDQWAQGFNLSWEIDFWGRFRRAILAADDNLGASIFNYDQVLVTLLGDVASTYIQIRTIQQQIDYLQANVDLQHDIFDITERRVKAGSKGGLDFHQSGSTLAQTEAAIPQLKIALRQANDRLCVLLGIPPTDLEKQLGPGKIPTVPDSVSVGIPAQLLCRRPDVRRAYLQAMSQGEQIGIAEADLYPAFAINGTIGWQAEHPGDIFTSRALTGNIGPTFQWNILNYGRIVNNERAQDAHFRALVMVYQETVLRANAEVEDGLAQFLQSQERAKLLDKSVGESQLAVGIIGTEYKGGASDFNRVALIQENLVQQQDQQALAHGDIAQGLIQVYRALGGGWQIPPSPTPGGMIVMANQPEQLPAAKQEKQPKSTQEAPVPSSPKADDSMLSPPVPAPMPTMPQSSASPMQGAKPAEAMPPQSSRRVQQNAPQPSEIRIAVKNPSTTNDVKPSVVAAAPLPPHQDNTLPPSAPQQNEIKVMLPISKNAPKPSTVAATPADLPPSTQELTSVMQSGGIKIVLQSPPHTNESQAPVVAVAQPSTHSENQVVPAVTPQNEIKFVLQSPPRMSDEKATTEVPKTPSHPDSKVSPTMAQQNEIRVVMRNPAPANAVKSSTGSASQSTPQPKEIRVILQ